MAKSQITVTMTPEMAKVFKAMSKLTAQQKKAEAGFEKVGKKAKGAGKQAEKSFDRGFDTSVVKRFATALVGAGGVLASLRMITKEMEYQRELDREKAAAQITVNQARQDVLRNLGGASVGEKQRVLTAGRSIAGAEGVPERFVQSAIAQAISASGGNIPSSIAAVKQAARFIPDRPEEMPLFAGGFLDLAKVTGTDDARTNQGLLQTVGALSRVVSPKQQATNIPQAMVGMVGQGATVQQGAALFAALSNAAADVEGNVTRTGLINFAEQINNALPSLGPDQYGADFGNLGQKIKAIQQNPEAGAAIAGLLTARAAVKVPLRQLLTDPTSVISTSFDRFQGLVPGNEGLASLADQAIADRNLDPLERNARFKRQLETSADLLQTADVEGGRRGIAREGLERLQRASGMSGPKATLQRLGVDYLSNDPEDAISELAGDQIWRRRFGAEYNRRSIDPAVRAQGEQQGEAAGIWVEMNRNLAEIAGHTAKTAETGVPTLLARPDEEK